jgi:phenylalanyl-tRNA synthetase alpha chain
MENKIKLLSEQIERFVIEGKDSLENFRIQFLGSKNVLKDLFVEIKNVPAENRKSVGQLINALKTQAQDKFDRK